jgi:DNA-binding MarR family transcriptional regulator
MTQSIATPGGADRLLTSGLADEVEFLVARAHVLGAARANALLEQAGLKVRSYSVLSLACGGTSPSQRELADFLRLDPSQIVALVDELELRGLVARGADPRDRRSKVILPTPAGRKLHHRAAELAGDAENLSLAKLSEEERTRLRGLLRRIAF